MYQKRYIHFGIIVRHENGTKKDIQEDNRMGLERIIGYENEKKDLKRIADMLRNPSEYEKFGVRRPNGLLLHGRPGVGKTLMAQSLIEECGLSSYIIRNDKDSKRFIDRIGHVFKEAEDTAPSVVLVDDLDKFSPVPDGCSREHAALQSHIDSVSGKDVFVIGTANNLHRIPTSLLRPGRFDHVIRIEPPFGNDHREIIRHYISTKKNVGELDFDEVAGLMDGRSCAELENIINIAGSMAAYERQDKITREYFIKAVLHQFHGVPLSEFEEGSRRASDLSDRNDRGSLVIWHEAGHAVVSEALVPGSVSVMTAYMVYNGIDNGITAFRSTLKNCNDMNYINICRFLGGIAADDIKLGVTGDGVDDDLRHAYNEAICLVNNNFEYGLGNYSYDHEHSNMSDIYRNHQEDSVRRLLSDMYLKTKNIINDNMDFLNALAEELNVRNYLTSKDIEVIRKNHPVKTVSLI